MTKGFAIPLAMRLFLASTACVYFALTALSGCSESLRVPNDGSGTGGNSAGGSAETGGASVGGSSSSGGNLGSGGGALSGGAPGTGGATVSYLIDARFDTATLGTYSQASVLSDFGFTPPWNDGLDEGRASILEESGNRFLRVTYPGGKYGPSEGGVQFRLPLGTSYQELYFSYRVRFGTGFEFVKGGKLPGLAGGSGPTGCSPKDDGFSARNMWRTGGHAVQYVYYPDQPNTCGDDLSYQIGGADFDFTPGQFHTVVHHIKMNTAGQADGILEAWVDGQVALSNTGFVFRIESANYEGIDTLYFSTFFGGNDATWAPATDQTADFDDFLVSEQSLAP